MTGRFVDLERAKAERLAKQEKPDAWRRANGNGEAGGATPNMRIITITGGGLADEAEQAEAALIEQRAPLFRRGADLVRPYTLPRRGFKGAITETAALQRCDEALLTYWLARCARFQRFDARSGEMRDINPPDHVAASILRRQDEWRFPPIIGVISAPTLRPDGTILLKEGYDPARPPNVLNVAQADHYDIAVEASTNRIKARRLVA
jgi:putative DNA primase/helicase